VYECFADFVSVEYKKNLEDTIVEIDMLTEQAGLRLPTLLQSTDRRGLLALAFKEE